MTTADLYINRVLDQLPRATPRREQIAMELRGHIAERLASGQSEPEVLRQLGDPLALAESYLAAVPLVSAPFMSRVAAKVVDGAVFVALVLGSIYLLWTRAPNVMPFALLFVIVAGSFAFAGYTAWAEAKSGQTIGKRLMRLRVVRESGARISAGQAIVRQLPMFFQVFVLDAAFALFTERSQRAFEMLSKTRVVRVTEE